MSSNRLLAIGLDGFETTIAERLIQHGRLPRLAHLMKHSARVDLDHGSAKRTGLAWEHFSTGLTPQSARRWSAVTFDPRRYECRQRPTRLPPFTSKVDVDTVVFDAPYFDLASAGKVHGLVAWGAHDPGTPRRSRPASLDHEVTERFGRYPAERWIYGFTWPSVDRTREMGDALARAARARAGIARWLLTERFPDWSLGIVVVSELHSAIEALWHGLDDEHPLHRVPSAQAAGRALDSVYEAVDELIGALAASLPDCPLVVFSMHGMGPNAADVPAMALLPELLYRRAFGHGMIDQANGDPVRELCAVAADSWTPHVRARWRGEVSGGQHRDRTLLARVAARGQRALSGRAAPDESALSWMPAAWYQPFWPRMRAFALPAFYDGQIRLNLHGRERHGIVAPADYDAVCDDVVAALEQCTDPVTGLGVVDEIVRTHPGDPFSLNGTEADIIVVWRGSPMAFATPHDDTIGPFAPRRPGGHTGGHGVSLWYGPDFDAAEHGARSAFDVVPTLVDFVTGATAADLDGQSFLDAIRTRGADVRTHSSIRTDSS